MKNKLHHAIMYSWTSYLTKYLSRLHHNVKSGMTILNKNKHPQNHLKIL